MVNKNIEVKKAFIKAKKTIIEAKKAFIKRIKASPKSSITIKFLSNVKKKCEKGLGEKPVKYTVWILVIAYWLVVFCMETVKQILPLWFDKTQWGALVSGSWAYIGTCFMGLLAIWQNQRFKMENDAAQAEMKK